MNCAQCGDPITEQNRGIDGPIVVCKGCDLENRDERPICWGPPGCPNTPYAGEHYCDRHRAWEAFEYTPEGW